MADRLRPALPAVIEQVIGAVAVEVPEYARPPGDPVGEILRTGVRVALEQLLELLGTDVEALGPARSVYERIGRGEYRARRPLESVLAAYRVGALVTWRGFSSAAVAEGTDPADIAQLAEACFAYIDQISAASTAGFTAAQIADAGRREGRRRELLGALLSGHAGDPATRELAADVGWEIPARLAVAVAPPGTPAPIGTLSGADDEGVLLVLTHPEAVPRRSLATSLGDGAVAVGTLQPPERAAASLRHAQALQALRGHGRIGSHGVLFAEDHLPDLLLTADPDLVAAITAPIDSRLADVPQSRRAVIVETALLWLLYGGARKEVADRMEKVREVLGPEPTEPGHRIEMLYALTVEYLRVGRTSGS